MKSKALLIAAGLLMTVALAGCDSGNSEGTGKKSFGDANIEGAKYTYTLDTSKSVSGRQGVAYEGGNYWVSDSKALIKYDADFNEVSKNEEPFKDIEKEVNHLGDVDVFNGEVFAGVELFDAGVGKNIQIAVYDSETLELKKTYPIDEESGQMEVSGIAVDPDSKTIFMASWIDDKSSSYIYMYDLENGSFKGKLHMLPIPKFIQGIAWYEGSLYVTSDDGDADQKAPDHIYRVKVDEKFTSGKLALEMAVKDVKMQGEIEGLTFNKEKKQLTVLYNSGAIIKDGIPSGFYDGYTEEEHEVYIYNIGQIEKEK